MRHFALIVSLAALLFSVAGCRFSSGRALVLGPYTDRQNEQVFAAALAAAQQQGYVPQDIDPAAGRFRMPAHTRVGARLDTMLTIQCYREGWIRMIPSGGYVQPTQDAYSMPTALKEEMESLAIGMREHLGTPGGQG